MTVARRRLKHTEWHGYKLPWWKTITIQDPDDDRYWLDVKGEVLERQYVDVPEVLGGYYAYRRKPAAVTGNAERQRGYRESGMHDDL